MFRLPYFPTVDWDFWRGCWIDEVEVYGPGEYDEEGRPHGAGIVVDALEQRKFAKLSCVNGVPEGTIEIYSMEDGPEGYLTYEETEDLIQELFGSYAGSYEKWANMFDPILTVEVRDGILQPPIVEGPWFPGDCTTEWQGMARNLGRRLPDHIVLDEIREKNEVELAKYGPEEDTSMINGEPMNGIVARSKWPLDRKVTSGDGKIVEGLFIVDAIRFGIIFWPDGRIYEGGLIDEYPHGFGIHSVKGEYDGVGYMKGDFRTNQGDLTYYELPEGKDIKLSSVSHFEERADVILAGSKSNPVSARRKRRELIAEIELAIEEWFFSPTKVAGLRQLLGDIREDRGRSGEGDSSSVKAPVEYRDSVHMGDVVAKKVVNDPEAIARAAVEAYDKGRKKKRGED